MDAAELDRFGESLIGFAATRAFIDNRGGDTDLVDVRFALNWTGTATSIGGHDAWHNPENPWYGASNALMDQWVNGIRYSQGTTYYPPTHEWGPSFAMWIGEQCVSLDPGLIPAGLAWDRCFSIEGDDIQLFHSPASGQTSFDGETYVLYDDDPMPQTVPGPGAAAVLGLGAVCVIRRKRGQNSVPIPDRDL